MRPKMNFAFICFVVCGLGCTVTSNSFSGDYSIVDTGQSSCYDNDGATIYCPAPGEAFYGQDAQTDGNQFNYTDNDDGTVTDNVTGLIWQQTPPENGSNYEEANEYCESLDLGGYDDWRLPTTKQLYSISDFSVGWPYLDWMYFDLAIAGDTVSKDEQYWTEYYVGTTTEGGTNAAFGVNHGTGHIKAYPAAGNAEGVGDAGDIVDSDSEAPLGPPPDETNNGGSGSVADNYLRCVRGNSSYGNNEFENNGDGTITDQATGLMWQQDDSGDGMDWETALVYAEDSTLGGYDDWRLPNVKELQSIIDYTHSPSASDAADLGPAIDTNFFTITELPSGTSAYDPDYGYFWSSTSAYFGGDSLEYYYAWYVAFGTAVDNDGYDTHGAGGARFDTKYAGGPLGEGGERYYNYVRLVRGANLLSQTQVSQLYVSIIGRASEGDGNEYWQSNQSDMTVAANSILNTEAAINYFGSTLNDNQEFIEFIYENTLGKTYAEDPDGVNYWVSELANGKSKGEVVVTLINAAMDPAYAGMLAQDQFINKVTVSNYVADTITTVPDVDDLSAFVGFISNVTYDSTTVVDAKSVVDAFDTEVEDETDFVAVDWTDETHSKDVDPNFDEVFDDTQVKRLDFVVTAERWQSMLDDMTELYGEFGQSSEQQLVEDAEDPIFVPAEVFYNDLQWYRVGIRFKGNSSLQSSWQNGVLKLSFKLDFDEYEDTYPQIKNQRFYGFKKFSLKNNYNDSSFLREKVAADIFADAGLAVSHTAFYALYIDHGDGPEYFGLYTLVEEVDGSVLDTQFISDEGNLYKPEDGSANFVEGTFSSEDFVKKTNDDEEDGTVSWDDIETLFSALHDASRITAPSNWRLGLEEIFDVDSFLHYLAVNGIIQNWDTYGIMPHNYYLYNDPATSKLTWIPWDHNEALQEGNMGGALALDFSDLSDEWPLIGKIYSDATYKATYDAYLSEVISSAFETEKMVELYEDYAEIVEPYATTEREGYTFLRNSNEFYFEIDNLIRHASDRATAVSTYLNN